mgnify:CR=1 FL=1
MSESDLYAHLIGECGVSPNDYWKLTDAEVSAIATGYQIRRSEEAANFRNVYHLLYSVNSKRKKTAKQLWPLPTDNIRTDGKSKLTFEQRMSLYEKIKMN